MIKMFVRSDNLTPGIFMFLFELITRYMVTSIELTFNYCVKFVYLMFVYFFSSVQFSFGITVKLLFVARGLNCMNLTFHYKASSSFKRYQALGYRKTVT